MHHRLQQKAPTSHCPTFWRFGGCEKFQTTSVEGTVQSTSIHLILSLLTFCHTCFLCVRVCVCIHTYYHHFFFLNHLEVSDIKYIYKKNHPLKYFSISLHHHITITTQKSPTDTKTLSKIQSRFAFPACPPNVLLHKLLFYFFWLQNPTKCYRLHLAVISL